MILRFRVWDKIEKKMYSVFAIDWYHQTILIERPSKNRVNEFYLEWKNLSRFELMQYTGLKDKNGVEIYEGDIVYERIFGGYVVANIGECEIVYDGERVYEFETTVYCAYVENRFGDKFSDVGDIKNLEVVGNIYENPELLEG